jgi:hypothetical protein
VKWYVLQKLKKIYKSHLFGNEFGSPFLRAASQRSFSKIAKDRRLMIQLVDIAAETKSGRRFLKRS